MFWSFLDLSRKDSPFFISSVGIKRMNSVFFTTSIQFWKPKLSVDVLSYNEGSSFSSVSFYKYRFSGTFCGFCPVVHKKANMYHWPLKRIRTYSSDPLKNLRIYLWRPTIFALLVLLTIKGYSSACPFKNPWLWIWCSYKNQRLYLWCSVKNARFSSDI